MDEACNAVRSARSSSCQLTSALPSSLFKKSIHSLPITLCRSTKKLIMTWFRHCRFKRCTLVVSRHFLVSFVFLFFFLCMVAFWNSTIKDQRQQWKMLDKYNKLPSCRVTSSHVLTIRQTMKKSVNNQEERNCPQYKYNRCILLLIMISI